MLLLAGFSVKKVDTHLSYLRVFEPFKNCFFVFSFRSKLKLLLLFQFGVNLQFGVNFRAVLWK